MKQKINTSASRGFRMKRLISFSFFLTRVIFNAVSLSLWMNVKFLCYETVNPMSQLILLFMQTTNEKRLRFSGLYANAYDIAESSHKNHHLLNRAIFLYFLRIARFSCKMLHGRSNKTFISLFRRIERDHNENIDTIKLCCNHVRIINMVFT